MRIVRSFGGPDTSSGVTDANGDYSIDQLEPGNKTFSFTREDILPVTKSVDLSGREAHLDAQLSSGTHVSGVVVTDSACPFRMPTSTPRVRSAARGGFRATKTDASGGFSFDAMAPGHYSFTASKTGYADGTLNDYDVSSNAPIADLAEDRRRHLRSRHRRRPRRHAEGQRHGAEQQRQRRGRGRWRRQLQDPRGADRNGPRFSAELMRSFGDSAAATRKTIDVAPGASVQVDIDFNTNTIVRGRVTRDGSPLAGANISFFPNDRSGAQVAVPTDDAGNYTASGLRTARTACMVVDRSASIRIRPTTTSTAPSQFDIDIRTALATGHVTDSGSGDPVANARIQMRARNRDQRDDPMRGASTDSSGNFTLDSVSPGTYTITADKEGYGNDVRDVAVTDSGVPPVELTIARNDGVTLQRGRRT